MFDDLDFDPEPDPPARPTAHAHARRAAPSFGPAAAIAPPKEPDARGAPQPALHASLDRIRRRAGPRPGRVDGVDGLRLDETQGAAAIAAAKRSRKQKFAAAEKAESQGDRRCQEGQRRGDRRRQEGRGSEARRPEGRGRTHRGREPRRRQPSNSEAVKDTAKAETEVQRATRGRSDVAKETPKPVQEATPASPPPTHHQGRGDGCGFAPQRQLLRRTRAGESAEGSRGTRGPRTLQARRCRQDAPAQDVRPSTRLDRITSTRSLCVGRLAMATTSRASRLLGWKNKRLPVFLKVENERSDSAETPISRRVPPERGTDRREARQVHLLGRLRRVRAGAQGARGLCRGARRARQCLLEVRFADAEPVGYLFETTRRERADRHQE